MSLRTRFRRSSFLVVYWQDNRLVFENFAQRTSITADPLAFSILHYCGDWRTGRQVCALLNQFQESSVLKSLDLLCKYQVLESTSEKPHRRASKMRSWTNWNPAAGYFHFSTKDTPFSDQHQAFESLKRRAKEVEPMPLPLKSFPKAPRTKLPRLKTEAEFPTVLKERRTWRKYGREPVLLEQVSAALELTFGIQRWVKVPGLGRAAIKTSPSCGSLHPIEAYVMVQRVKGLDRGIYHYDPERHELEWLRDPVPARMVEKHLGNQWWFGKAAFFVLMTAVFERTAWKYRLPRVYRGILIEAGHLCQTFCLTATWLKLAPFCTMAQTDTQWEKWLGIDGVTESILYVAGAGTRPSDKDMKNAHAGTLVSYEPAFGTSHI